MNRFLTTEAATNKLNDSMEFISQFRNESWCDQLRANINTYRTAWMKNYNSTNHYIDELFEQNARLLVIRIDFGYGKTTNPYSMTEDGIYNEYLQARLDIDHFFNNTRSNSLFDHMVGYVWKLEYGLDKGFHYHMLFFFDGSKVMRDVRIAMLLGEYWDIVVTRGRGMYYNCNSIKENYKICGIGEINYFDSEQIEALKYTAEYLTKPDYYGKIFTKKGRTFGRGEMPQPRTDNRGRPREHCAQV